MRDRTLRITAVLLALLVAGAAVPPPAGAEEDILDALKAQTVMITVEQSGRPVEYGSGVVLCQVEKKVYVLTAHHVLAGKSDKPSGKNTLRLRRIEKAEVSFFGNNPPPVGKDDFTVNQVPDEDLLLLSFPLEQVMPPATLDTPEVVDEATESDDRPVVFSVGFWKDQSQSWAHREGRLLPSAGKLVHHSGEIFEGFSGGPLFNEAGSLIGINIERVAGEAIGAEIGSWYGEALAMDEILPAIDKWVPSKCLKSASPLSELAYLTYRKAMRAVSIKRWPRAEELMAQAIKQQPLEGGSVHLEGLRYTPYLPLYHRGLALYKLADNADSSFEAAQHYSDAIREFERSEAQGEIKGNKRYKSLKRLTAKSYKELQKHSTPKTEEEKAAWEEAQKKAQAAKAARAAKEAEEAAARAAELAAKAKAEADKMAAAEAAREQEIAEAAAAALAAAKAAEEEEARRLAEAERAALRQVASSVTSCANLRTGPSRSAGRVDCLKPGTRSTLIEEQEGWSHLRLEDGREGWMASRLLEGVDTTPEG